MLNSKNVRTFSESNPKMLGLFRNETFLSSSLRSHNHKDNGRNGKQNTNDNIRGQCLSKDERTD